MKYNILYLDSSQGMFGGGQVSLFELVKRIDILQFYPHVILSEEGELPRRLKASNIDYTIISMPSFKKAGFGFIKTLIKLILFIKHYKISLIHTNTSRSTIYGILTAKLLNIPLIWHVRVPLSDGLLDRFLSLFALRLIVVSEAVRKRFPWLKQDKIEIIYNGVDTEIFSPGSIDESLRYKLGIKNNDIIIGAVGRISPEKGLEFLISAMPEIIKTYPKAKVLIVGEGNEKYCSSLQKTVNELHISFQNVIFTGFCSDIFQVLRCVHIFCLPSLTEGFNRSLLEAMSCGLPVVATDIDGNREIVKDGINGLLVPSKDPNSLAYAIIKLIEDKDTSKRIGQRARQFIIENFSIEKNVKKTEELYKKILENLN